MDWLTFIAQIVGALAWPGALVITILIIRKPLLSAMPFLRKLKYSDVEVEFGQEISSLRKEVIEASIKDSSHPFAWSPIPERIVQIASISPRAAVLESWKEVEASVIARSKSYDDLSAKSDGMSASDLVEVLEKSGKLDKRLSDLFRRQKALANKYEFSSEETQVDADMALELMDANMQLALLISRA